MKLPFLFYTQLYSIYFALYFKVTPVLGVVGVLLTLVAVHEPKRGAIETKPHKTDVADELSESVPLVQEHSYLEDLKKILRV